MADVVALTNEGGAQGTGAEVQRGMGAEAQRCGREEEHGKQVQGCITVRIAKHDQWQRQLHAFINLPDSPDCGAPPGSIRVRRISPLVASQQQGHVLPAEAEGIDHGHPARMFPGHVRHVIQVAFRIGCGVVDGGRDEAAV